MLHLERPEVAHLRRYIEETVDMHLPTLCPTFGPLMTKSTSGTKEYTARFTQVAGDPSTCMVLLSTLVTWPGQNILSEKAASGVGNDSLASNNLQLSTKASPEYIMWGSRNCIRYSSIAMTHLQRPMADALGYKALLLARYANYVTPPGAKSKVSLLVIGSVHN